MAEREATAAHMSGRQQKSARTKGRARWEAVVREVQRGDLRTTYALSSAAYGAQRIACEKAYRAEADARRAAGGEAPSDLYTDVEGEYTAITCGWTACGRHAARDFKLLVGCATIGLHVKGLPSLDIIPVKTQHKTGDSYVALV